MNMTFREVWMKKTIQEDSSNLLESITKLVVKFVHKIYWH